MPMRPVGAAALPASKHGHSQAQPHTAQQRWSLGSGAAEQQGEEDLNLGLHAAGSGAWVLLTDLEDRLLIAIYSLLWFVF